MTDLFRTEEISERSQLAGRARFAITVFLPVTVRLHAEEGRGSSSMENAKWLRILCTELWDVWAAGNRSKGKHHIRKSLPTQRAYKEKPYIY